MKHFRPIIIAFLLGVSVFSVYRYILSIKEKYALLEAIDKGKTQIAALENEKQNILQTLEKEEKINLGLSQKNARLRENLKAGRQKIARLFLEVVAAGKDAERLDSQVSALKAENAAIQEEEANLRPDLARISREKEALESRLSSIAELKKAIKELKKGQNRVALKKKEPKTELAPEGNRGYLVKDGVPISPPKVKIEVNPAQENKQ